MVKKQSITSFSEEITAILPYIIRGILKRQTDALKQGTITISQYLMLDLLNTHNLLKMKDIAHELNISLPAATGLINRLYSIKMVERIYDKNDRRVIYVKVTAKGKNTIEKIGQQRQRAIKDIFSKLTEKERKDYLKILKKLKVILYREK